MSGVLFARCGINIISTRTTGTGSATGSLCLTVCQRNLGHTKFTVKRHSFSEFADFKAAFSTTSIGASSRCPHFAINIALGSSLHTGLFRRHYCIGNVRNLVFSRLLSSASSESPTKSDELHLTDMSPAEFSQYLRSNKIKRCFMIYDKESGKVKTSHPEIESFGQFFSEDTIDFRKHEGVFLELGKRTGSLLGAFVWKSKRGQPVGGVRLWQYENMEKYLRDGLRLSEAGGFKAALAGLWVGGGIGVMCQPENNKHKDPVFRMNMFLDYGDFITSLNGCYVVARDVGVSEDDINYIFNRSRYVTCISPDLGGSGDPSITTGKGVVSAMEGALDFCDDFTMGGPSGTTLQGKTVAIQGAGSVSKVIIEELLKKDVRHIYVTDCHRNRVDDIKLIFADRAEGRLSVEKVPLDNLSVLSYPCDILSPCALGNILHSETIPSIQAKIICGAANNQLGCESDNQLLVDHGITYVPDFLANRMGVVSFSIEAFGRLPEDPTIEKHFDKNWENSIFQLTKRVLKKAHEESISPEAAAMQLAEPLINEDHPQWPGRSQQIIDALVSTNWHKGADFWDES